MKAKKLAKLMGSKVTIINVATDLPAYVQGKHVDTIKKAAIKHQNEIKLILFQQILYDTLLLPYLYS